MANINISTQNNNYDQPAKHNSQRDVNQYLNIVEPIDESADVVSDRNFTSNLLSTHRASTERLPPILDPIPDMDARKTLLLPEIKSMV